jgi:hypothetical protein
LQVIQRRILHTPGGTSVNFLKREMHYFCALSRRENQRWLRATGPTSSASTPNKTATRPNSYKPQGRNKTMTSSTLELIGVALHIAVVFLNALMCYKKIQEGNKDAAIAWLVALIWAMKSAQAL